MSGCFTVYYSVVLAVQVTIKFLVNLLRVRKYVHTQREAGKELLLSHVAIKAVGLALKEVPEVREGGS